MSEEIDRLDKIGGSRLKKQITVQGNKIPRYTISQYDTFPSAEIGK